MAHAAAPAQNRAAQVGGEIIGGALFGYATSALFTTIDPMGGLFFGAAFGTVRNLTDSLLSFMGESEAAKTARFILSNLAGILAGVAVSTAMGITLTVQAGCTLAVVQIVVAAALPLLCISLCLPCLASLACVGD
jgi:hypothetical protein